MPIKVTHVQQSNPVWCWAACCEMFVKYYEKGSETQAGFAHLRNAKFGHGLDSMADYTETAWCLKNQQCAVERFHAPLSWDEVQKVLGNNRLIIASAGNHAWLLVGAEVDRVHGNILWVHDPSKDSGPNKVQFSVFSKLWLRGVMLSQDSSDALD